MLTKWFLITVKFSGQKTKKTTKQKKEPYCILAFLGSITSRTFLGGRIVLSLFFECFMIFVFHDHQQKNVNRSFLYRQQQAMHTVEHVENQLNPSLPTSESAGLEEGKKTTCIFRLERPPKQNRGAHREDVRPEGWEPSRVRPEPRQKKHSDAGSPTRKRQETYLRGRLVVWTVVCVFLRLDLNFSGCKNNIKKVALH